MIVLPACFGYLLPTVCYSERLLNAREQCLRLKNLRADSWQKLTDCAVMSAIEFLSVFVLAFINKFPVNCQRFYPT